MPIKRTSETCSLITQLRHLRGFQQLKGRWGGAEVGSHDTSWGRGAERFAGETARRREFSLFPEWLVSPSECV